MRFLTLLSRCLSLLQHHAETYFQEHCFYFHFLNKSAIYMNNLFFRGLEVYVDKLKAERLPIVCLGVCSLMNIAILAAFLQFCPPSSNDRSDAL